MVIYGHAQDIVDVGSYMLVDGRNKSAVNSSYDSVGSLSTSTRLLIHSGLWGDWMANWVGPDNTFRFACGAQIRYEDPISGDNTGMNGEY